MMSAGSAVSDSSTAPSTDCSASRFWGGAVGPLKAPPSYWEPCPFCRDKVDFVDYKDFGTLRRAMSEKGKIRSARITGACRRHQVQLARAVKRARELALLPYVGDTRESRDDRDRDRGRDRDRER